MALMSDEPEVKTVFAQIRRPSKDDEGQVVMGFYIIEDGAVFLTDKDGTTVREFGRYFSQKLCKGDDPRVIAARLTKELRNALLGKSPTTAGFSKPLVYPDMKF